MTTPLLEIKDLHVSVEGTEILHGLSLSVNAGEVHAIMGPNGSGKSTLTKVLSGHEAYQVTSGSAQYKGKDLLALEPEIRAREGLFLAFQYPLEIPGVSNTYFLRAALNAHRKHRGEPEMDAAKFLEVLKEKAKQVDVDPALLNRPINEGFSGGEKKRNEILQMAVLEPKLAILDELDSGLDIDALRILGEAVNRLMNPERGLLLITHFPRILESIAPHFVHVLSDGRIVKQGGVELAHELEERGYDWVKEEAAAAGRA